MINPNMQQAVNTQVQKELSSAYLYLSMANWSEAQSLKGFGHWFRKQASEEYGHAQKLTGHLLERGGKVTLQALPAPQAEFGSVLQAFEATLEHERSVTESIHALYATAVAEKDLAAQLFLQWFVTEQVEEEAAVNEILDKLRLAGDRGGTLLYLDKELGKRE